MSIETTAPNRLEMNEFEKPQLPKTLNILTILTFIGCGILLLFSLATPSLLKFSKNMMEKANTAELSPKEVADMEKGRLAIQMTEQYMVPLMIAGIVGIILCFIGALMMRKLKKDGYWLYLAGQLVPYIASIAIMGLAQFTGPSSFIFPVITLIFIVLYTTQRKHLVY